MWGWVGVPRDKAREYEGEEKRTEIWRSREEAETLGDAEEGK